MTDLQRVNIKNFMWGIISLHNQTVLCRELSPVSLVGRFDTTVHLEKLSDFVAIQDIFNIPNDDIEIKDLREEKIPSVHYMYYVMGVKVLYVALKGKPGFGLPKTGVDHE